jgi:succinate-semialdehyde dehydrogenase/glutarate-semialdehyde dehydrogenase
MEKTISYNPATGEKIGETPVNTVDELKAAVDKAKSAQQKWAKLSFNDRRDHILKIRDYITENADRFSEVISKDSGKTVFDALSTEVMPSVLAINYYAKNAKRVLKRKRLKPGNILLANKISYIDRVPFGVIGIISPWNYPFGIPVHEVVMALISGNAVVLKAASQTQEVAKLIEEAVKTANLPDGLFSLLNIPGSIAGDAFIDSGINKLFFTGSVPVGKKLMKKAAERLLPISLELGGNDAMIVLDDADVHRVAAGALWAGLSNSGQSCAGVERIFVQQNIYSRFMEEIKRQAASLRQGMGTSFEIEIGCMTTESQLKTVKTHLEDAISKGGKVTEVGIADVSTSKGLFHRPYFVENVTSEMLMMKEETFGPLLGIQKFSTIEDVITMANDSNLGLTASVWSSDKTKCHAIASKLEAGTITLNDHLMSHGLAETPWGGFKESGFERTHGEIGLEAMTQPRCVVDDLLPGVKRNMWWYPHNQSVYEGLRGGIELLYSKSIPIKFNGALKLVKTFFRTFTENR